MNLTLKKTNRKTKSYKVIPHIFFNCIDCKDLEIPEVMNLHTCFTEFCEHLLSYLLSKVHIYNPTFQLTPYNLRLLLFSFLSQTDMKWWMKKPLSPLPLGQEISDEQC